MIVDKNSQKIVQTANIYTQTDPVNETNKNSMLDDIILAFLKLSLVIINIFVLFYKLF